MEPDFSGYATKAGLRCADGLIIMPEAFKHCDKITVPLVWQHGHSTADNVLGHAVLEARPDGVYAHGYFNNTKQGQNAKALVSHGDITALSIYANQLVKRAKQVFHGMIREVSLVLSGANPGALIDYVSVAHGDDIEQLEDEAIIYTGLELIHREEPQEVVEEMAEEEYELIHADDLTVQDVYDDLSEEQKNVVHYMIGAALEVAAEGSSASQSATEQEGPDMGHRNVFDQSDDPVDEGSKKNILSHSDVKGIVAEAVKFGSLREAVEHYAVKHGIEDIDTLFPDAKLLTSTPDFNARRTEWVKKVLGSTRHTPFSRVKTIVADLTQEQARAKGYIKGTLKKEEWFGLTKRTTTPTTIYKKQQLDRDDVVDITDFDVVVWLKGEMRLMLEEEIARAILISDGRDVSDVDKVKDPIGASDGAGIRSILNDHELFVTTVNVNVDDASSSYDEVVDAVMDGMEYFKGTGTPDFFTTIRTINMFLKAKDTLGRRLYANVSEVSAAMGVASVIPVEVMNADTDVIGIIVNLSDYNVGSDKGGEISLFDDFDIDYNQQKYLIETRLSGALTRIKSALVIRKVASASVLAVPPTPEFDAETNTITIPTDIKVVYKIGAATQAQGTDVVITGDTTVVASPAAGYFFAFGNKSWEFEYTA